MASSKVMPTNHDPPRVQSSSTPHYNKNNSLNKTLSSIINMDEILSNIYSDPPPTPSWNGGGGAVVWKEMATGRGEAEMTLEDFLSKAGAEEGGGGGRETVVVVGNGSGNGGGGGRGKRRAVVVEEPPMDKATQQKQRRMIKNRESAARSRERKQAYTVELEALVTQLEEENARLVRQEAEESKKRFKQLMENLIPVEDKQKPPRRIQTLRRSNSMCW